MSQIDLSKPQSQRTIQLRESASMLRAQLAGKIAMKNFWIRLIRDNLRCHSGFSGTKELTNYNRLNHQDAMNAK